MKIIGLTGGSGAGKGIVSAVFAEKGIPVLDCDKVSREVTSKGSPCLTELSAAFGEDILNPDGTLNRPSLAEKAFSDRDRLTLLNSITHRHILSRCEDWLRERESEGNAAAVLDAPQLFESGFDKRCDIIVSVVAQEDIRLERIVRRDGISEEKARGRLRNQYPDSFFIEKSHYVLENNGSPEQLAAKAAELAGKIYV